MLNQNIFKCMNSREAAGTRENWVSCNVVGIRLLRRNMIIKAENLVVFVRTREVPSFPSSSMASFVLFLSFQGTFKSK